MEQSSLLPSLLRLGTEKIGISLHDEQVEQFMAYLEQLQVWNRSFNLTGITSGKEIVIKHFIDSLCALPAIKMKVESALLDIGTGAGFPGLPLKIVRPDIDLSLVEPSPKKCSFLRFILGLLRLEKVTIFNGTLDQYMAVPTTPRLFDYITTRALKAEVILNDGFKLLHQDGKAILYSSQSIHTSTWRKNWTLTGEHMFRLPEEYGQRVVSIFSVLPHTKHL